MKINMILKEYHNKDIEEKEKEKEKAKIQANNRISHERYTEYLKEAMIFKSFIFSRKRMQNCYTSMTKSKSSVWERALAEKNENHLQKKTSQSQSRFSTPNRPIRSSGFNIVHLIIFLI